MYRSREFLFLILFAALVCLPGYHNALSQNLPKTVLKSGEKLSYSVRWRLIPAGEAELVLGIDAQSSQWKVTAKANSVGYITNLYKVEDEYSSLFHNSTFCSSEIKKTINQGDRHREISLQFDQQRQKAILRDKNLVNGATPKQEQFNIPVCVHDILSALYFSRTVQLEEGRQFEFSLNDGSPTKLITAEVQTIEEVQTEIGRFMAFRIEPDVFDGNLFKGKGRLFVWFSNDANRIPVQFKAQTSLGTITASLTGIENDQLQQ